MQQKKHNS